MYLKGGDILQILHKDPKVYLARTRGSSTLKNYYISTEEKRPGDFTKEIENKIGELHKN